ncbi:hypothetical protein [Cucumibacter marinus]|uniref:hypothetical protein n=1 Tax=Cucumibacter marinus TaxID=1121252 RepID=UPI00040DC3D7|nr:hypothetical protein [Cucumibacter marinus]
MSFETVLSLRDSNKARVIIVALKAHGFHPLEGGEDGLPGMPGITGRGGIAIRVPAEEAEDAKVLAEALLADMNAEGDD